MKTPPRFVCLARALPLGAMFLLAACQTAPVAPKSTTPAPVKSSASSTPAKPEKPLQPGVVLSEPLHGSLSMAFAKSAEAGQQTFPRNRTGASLAFDSALRMPLLEAVDLGENKFRYNMRFANATRSPLVFSVVCYYSDTPKPVRSIQAITLPVDTFRDLSIDFEGDITRKIGINAHLDNKP